MAFEFKLSTDEIREKMFDFIKPVYKDIWDSDVSDINWVYGVYDSKSGLFITYVRLEKNHKNDQYNKKYVLITESGKILYIVAHRYDHSLINIPLQIKKYESVIQAGIKLYNDQVTKNCFLSSFSDEQEKCLDEITENMKDRCKISVDINNYEDAEKLFYQDNFNYYYISRMYNKNTIANFDRYMSDDMMRFIRGKKYRDIIAVISSCGNKFDEEKSKQISKEFSEAMNLFSRGIDDIYAEITFEVIKNDFLYENVKKGYVCFVEQYIKNCIKFFSHKIQDIRPVLDYINKFLPDEAFESLVFYKKELEKRIYNKVEGFQFVITTDEIREKMFDFLKPKYKTINDWNVTNINWTTGVYDRNKGIFLTRIYFLSDAIARCGVDSYGYIVITDGGNIFRVYADYEYEKRAYKYSIPEQFEILTENIKEGIAFYGYNYAYESTLSEDVEKELKEIKREMSNRCR